MKCFTRLLFQIVIIILFASTSLTSVQLSRKPRNNGFRVLMASKGFYDDFSDFIMGILKASKILENVKALASCINDLIKTFSSLAVVTQKLNETPSLVNFMGVLGSMNQIVKDASNNLICGDVAQQFRRFLDTFINDPNIGRRDSNEYFKQIIQLISNKSTRVYHEFVRSYDFYKRREFYKAGEVIGDLFYNVVRLKEANLSDDPKDLDNKLITDPAVFQNDANQFKQRFGSCVSSFQKVLPDIYNFYSSTVEGPNIIPTVADLFKSMFETNQLMQCFDNMGRVYNDIIHSNYNFGFGSKDKRVKSPVVAEKKNLKEVISRNKLAFYHKE